MAKTFGVTDEQEAKILAWMVEQNAIVQGQQLESSDPVIRGMAKDGAYYGAIGGGVSYCFTPTSIGVALTVVHSVTKNEINVTDYDLW